MFKKMCLWTILIVLFLLLTCMISAATPKDVLVMGIDTNNFKSFDPAVSGQCPPNNIIVNMYGGLVRVEMKDEKFIVVPGFAESWEVAPDGKTWTFHLRKGLVFANGDSIKSDAVVYSFRRFIKIQGAPSWKFIELLGLTEESITAPDDYTVRIVTNGTLPNIVLTVMGSNNGAILNPKVVQEHEVDGDMGRAWLKSNSAGGGPYILEEWDPRVKVVLKANENYWRGAPRIKTIIFQDIPESTDQFLYLKKGDIDVAWDLSPEQANSLKGSSDISIVSSPQPGLEYLSMNASWGPFKDVRVRQAVKYAIDYDAIIDKIKGGFGIKNQQFLPLGFLGYVENNPYYLDIEKAKKLMAEAGYADGFDVELNCRSMESQRAEAVVIQDNLAKIGIRVKISVITGSQLNEKHRTRQVQMLVGRWQGGFPDSSVFANPFTNYRAKKVADRAAWYDDYAADLAEAAVKERNEDRRSQMYQDLTNYWHIYGPFAILYQRWGVWGVRNEVKGFDKAAEGYAVHLDLTKAYKVYK